MELNTILIGVIVLLVVYMVWMYFKYKQADEDEIAKDKAKEDAANAALLAANNRCKMPPSTKEAFQDKPYDDYNEHIINQVFNKRDFARHAEFSNNAPNINTFGLRTQRTDRQNTGAWSVFPPKFEAKQENPHMMSVSSDIIGYYSR